MAELGVWVVPCVMTVCALLLLRHGELTDVFLSGAKDGISTAFGLLPTLLLLLPAVRVFTAGGILSLIGRVLSAPLAAVGLNVEALAVFLLRPLSFGAANGLLHELHRVYGADSYAACAAGIFFGTVDTVFYMLTCYMGGAGIQKSRGCLPAAMLTTAASVIISCLLARLLV